MSKSWSMPRGAENSLFPSMPEESPGRSASAAIALYAQPVFLFCLTFFVATVFSRLSADTHHDGVLLKPAIDVANGKMLFRDTFTQYGALTTLFQAWAIKIFGPYLVVIKTTTAFFYALASVLLWMNWSKLVSPWLATLCAILWLAMAPFLVAVAFPWSSVYALVFQLLSAYLLILFVEHPRQRYIYLAGVAAGLCFWCRQPTGVLNYVAIHLVLLIFAVGGVLNWRRFATSLLVLTAGCATTFAVFIPWLALNGAMFDWYMQSILFSFAFGEGLGGGYSLSHLINTFFPFPNNKWAPGYVWDLLPTGSLVLLGVLLVGAWLRRQVDRQSAIIFAALIPAIASWHQYYPFPDLMKTFWANGFMLGLLAVLLVMLIPLRSRVWREVTAAGLITLMLAPHLYARWPYVVNYYQTINVKLDKPEVLQGMLLSKEQASYLSDFSSVLDSYLSAHPKTNFINVTTDALYLTFREDRARSYHPAYVKWGIIQYMVYKDYQKRMLDYMARERPLALVYLPPQLVAQTGSKDNVPFVFNAEETFVGYAVFHRFAGGITLIGPARCISPDSAGSCATEFE